MTVRSDGLELAGDLEAGVTAEPDSIQKPREVVVLFLAANPLDTDRLRLDKEAREIENHIRRSENRDTVEFLTKWAVRPLDLLSYLNQHKPTVVHFSAHGSSQEIMLEDANGTATAATPTALASLFKALGRKPAVVVLNCCHSSDHASMLTSVVDCAIGINAAIGDAAAIVFASAFYQAIGYGCPIQEAFDQAIVALQLEGIPEETTPQLYVRTGVDASQLVLSA